MEYNVKELKTQKELELENSQKCIISLLEEALEKAKAGELKAIAICSVAENEVHDGVEWGDEYHALMGSLTDLQIKMYNLSKCGDP